MKRIAHALALFSLLTLFSPAGFSRDSAKVTSEGVDQQEAAGLLEEMLAAHGGRSAISSVSGFYAELTKLTYTSPEDYFERKVRVWADGERFERQFIHPNGLRERRETFDGQGGLKEEVVSQEGGANNRQVVATDSGRLGAVQFGVETCNLILFLVKLSQQGVTSRFLERTPQMLDKLIITTRRNEYIVFVDQSRLIRRLEIGELVFQFADYRPTNGLMLPRVQRVSVGNRLAYELFFSEIQAGSPFNSPVRR
jgi:hypothetical protein